MERYKITLAQKAEEDIRSAVRYIAVDLREPATAERMHRRFMDGLTSLKTMPERFRLAEDDELAAQGLRVLPVGNYLIFYTVDRREHCVYIPRILYGRRDWLNILKSDSNL